MTEDEFKELFAYGREQYGVEFKGPGSKTENKHLLAKVVRATLSMANRRNGGFVIIGIDEDGDGKLIPTGLSDEDITTWNYDSVADSIAQYADPNVAFDLETIIFQGRKFVAIKVYEFVDIPVICKKDYQGVLRNGACYVRTRRKPETADIPSQTEMRDLLELATVKSIRRYISLAQEAHLEISDALVRKDEEMYSKQLGDLLEE